MNKLLNYDVTATAINLSDEKKTTKRNVWRLKMQKWPTNFDCVRARVCFLREMRNLYIRRMTSSHVIHIESKNVATHLTILYPNTHAHTSHKVMLMRMMCTIFIPLFRIKYILNSLNALLPHDNVNENVLIFGFIW